MARIAVGGWQHETNTFATVKADYAAFERADEWPELCCGQQMIDQVREVHLPVAGAIKAIEQAGHQVAPLMWCAATPSAQVTREAFESLAEKMLELLDQAMPVDGIYLDLHGAMVGEDFEDGEGELLSRIRGITGEQMPIFVSLDLHANITEQMVDRASVLDVFRTYPHIDMGQTGYRTAKFLCQQIEQPRIIYKSLKKADFLIALNSGCTDLQPCRGIYSKLPEFISAQVPALSLACGFHLADIVEAGPAVVAYGFDSTATESAAADLLEIVNSERKAFGQKIWLAEAGIQQAEQVFKSLGATVVLADTQDNPGGGGTGDTVGVLQAMIDAGLDNALVGLINDPQAARLAHQTGVGGSFDCLLGGKIAASSQHQLKCQPLVEALSDGRFTATGPMYHGARMQLGPTALLRIEGVLVAITSKPVQTADKSCFRHLGVEPGAMDYVAVKSSVHFRNDFSDIASEILVLAAPGEVYADPGVLPYHNLRPGVDPVP